MASKGKKAKAIPAEFAVYVEKAENRKKKLEEAKKNKGLSSTMPINLLSNYTAEILTEDVELDKECGCYGSIHSVINNCMKCGRVICKAEGERPCPYCGTLVFSDETLLDPELLAAKAESLELLKEEKHWVPLNANDLILSQIPTNTQTRLIDLEKDWFDPDMNTMYIDEEDEDEGFFVEN